MLIIDRVTKTYRGAAAPALDGVSFSVDEGELVALLGPNGAGKSTLVSILSGRVDPDEGAATLHGERLARSRPDLRATIGVVPQEVRLDFVFTVEEIMRLEMGFYGLRRDDAYIGHLLERLSLADKRRLRTRALSGGMQRRLMIARALVHRPRLLLLDEPTAGVDLALRQSTYAFLRELNAAGTTILLTTHYLEEAETLCGRVVLLERGRLVADETREDFVRLAGDFLTVDIRSGAPDRVWPYFEGEHVVRLMHTADRLRFTIPGSRREPLLRGLAAASRQIDSFQVTRPRLEEAFAKLTGREVGDANNYVA
jgi:ABC-2 type transport system ATP-binding protein